MSLLVAVLLCASSDGGVLFTLTERTERGRVLPYPEASIVDVDVNSDIDIIVNRELLSSLAGGAAGETDRQRRAKALQAILEDLRAALREVYQAQERGEVSKSAFRRVSAAQVAIKAYFVKSYGDERGKAMINEAIVAAGMNADVGRQNLLAVEIAQLTREIASADGGVATLELAGFVGATQVHLPGYDALAAGSPVFIEKTRFVFDEKFNQEYEAAKELATAAKDYDSLLSKVQERFFGKVEAGNATANEALEELQKLANDIAADPSVVAAVDAVKKFVEATKALVEQLTAVVAAIQTPGEDPAQLISKVVGGAQTAQDLAKEAVKAGRAAFEAVKALPGALGTYTPRVRALIEKLLPLEALAGNGEAVQLPEIQATTPQPLTEAQNTTLSLPKTDRKEDDIVTVRARVLKPDGSVLAGYEHERVLRVHARGFVADTGAVVMLVRGIFNAPGTMAPGNFVPSAGAYAVLRFKGFRMRYGAGSPLFHLLAPGLGVAVVAVPVAADGTTRLVIMATGQLFEDVLQIGIGLDLRGQPFWGFGIGLHKLGLGKTFF